jgi:hypothetical protein
MSKEKKPKLSSIGITETTKQLVQLAALKAGYKNTYEFLELELNKIDSIINAKKLLK